MSELIYILRISLAIVLSFFVGLEREKAHKEAGLRTIMLISLGSVVFSLIPFIIHDISQVIDISFDFSRPVGYLIAGIGLFAGAGVSKGENGVEGVTTAGAIWSTCAMSCLCGLGKYYLAIFVALIIWLILRFKKVLNKVIK